MIDMVPKAVVLTLVNHSKENLQRELLQELYKPEVLDDLMKESEFVVNRRKEVVGMVSALNKAEECVSFCSITGYLLIVIYRAGSWLEFRRMNFCYTSCLNTSINTLYIYFLLEDFIHPILAVISSSRCYALCLDVERIESLLTVGDVDR